MFHAIYGRCYLLHSDQWPAQTHVSPTAGITLAFASLTSDPTNLTKYPMLNQGIYLEMLDTYEYASNTGYFFEPNKNVMLSLKKITYDRSKKSKIGCVPVEEAEYASSTGCQDVCWFRQYQSSCNCTKQIGYYPFGNRTMLPFCEVLDAMKCLAENVQQYNENYIKCLLDFCKPLCDENVYTATVTSNTIKSSMVESYVPKRLKNFDGFIRVNILYHSMSFEKVFEQETLTLQNVISLLGGQIGFWFGGSLITIIQAFVIGMVFIKRRFQKLINAAEIKEEKIAEGTENECKTVTEATRSPLGILGKLASKLVKN